MSLNAGMRCKAAIACAAILLSVGCDKLREWAPKVTGVVVSMDGSPNAGRAKVIPTRGLPRRFIIKVERERSLTYFAQELGMTLADLIALNKLTETVLHEGQELHVDARPPDVARFWAKREARKAREAAAAKKAIADAKAKKIADAQAKKAAKQAKQKKAAKAAAASKRAASRRARVRRAAAKRAATKRAKASASRRRARKASR